LRTQKLEPVSVYLEGRRNPRLLWMRQICLAHRQVVPKPDFTVLWKPRLKRVLGGHLVGHISDSERDTVTLVRVGLGAVASFRTRAATVVRPVHQGRLTTKSRTSRSRVLPDSRTGLVTWTMGDVSAASIT